MNPTGPYREPTLRSEPTEWGLVFPRSLFFAVTTGLLLRRLPLGAVFVIALVVVAATSLRRRPRRPHPGRVWLVGNTPLRNIPGARRWAGDRWILGEFVYWVDTLPVITTRTRWVPWSTDQIPNRVLETETWG